MLEYTGHGRDLSSAVVPRNDPWPAGVLMVERGRQGERRGRSTGPRPECFRSCVQPEVGWLQRNLCNYTFDLRRISKQITSD